MRSETVPGQEVDPPRYGLSDDGLLEVLARAFEDNATAIAITDPEGRIEYANRGFLELTGYDVSELIGAPASMLRASRPADWAPTNWQELGTRPLRTAFHGRRKDGEEFWLSMAVSALRDSQGAIIHLLGIGQEVARYRGAADNGSHVPENSADMVLVADLEGTILFVDRTVPGVPREEAIGKKIFDFAPPDQADRLRSYMMLVVQSRTSQTYEIPAVGPHGSVEDYIVQVGPIEVEGRVVALSFASWAVRSDVADQFAPSQPGDAATALANLPELTSRELEVLALLARGLTNREAAERLELSRRTIDHHVAHILNKLSAPNRTAAVVAAEKGGLLPLGDPAHR